MASGWTDYDRLGVDAAHLSKTAQNHKLAILHTRRIIGVDVVVPKQMQHAMDQHKAKFVGRRGVEVGRLRGDDGGA